MKSELEARVHDALAAPDGIEQRLLRCLEIIVAEFSATTCTLHTARPGDRSLDLVCHVGLPPKIAEIVAVVPYGKGMAGICAERGEAITVCNLQTDASGVVRPGAKETGVSGSIVVPLFRDGTIGGTLGLGKSSDYTYSPGEEAELRSLGGIILEALLSSRGRGRRER